MLLDVYCLKILSLHKLSAARPRVVVSYKLHDIIYEEQAPTGEASVFVGLAA